MEKAAPKVTITHHAQPSGGHYLAHVAGESATGTLEWEPRVDGARIATHTVVPPAIGGRGVAARLVERMVADAQTHGFKVVPQCSYVAAMFDRHPEWADLDAR